MPSWKASICTHVFALSPEASEHLIRDDSINEIMIKGPYGVGYFHFSFSGCSS
jgi:hypothetical protein